MTRPEPPPQHANDAGDANAAETRAPGRSPDPTPDHKTGPTPDHAIDQTPASLPDAAPPASAAARAGKRNALVAVVALVAFALGLWLGGGSEPGGHEHAGAEAAAEAQVWTCSMHPQVRSPEPGACPICGMDLIPVSEAGGGDDDDTAPRRVALSPAARELARIRTRAVVTAADSARALHLLGRVDYDETRTRTITAWTAGRLERLRVATTGQRIRAGQPVADIYSPELYSAQEDLQQARRQLGRLQHASPTVKKGSVQALEATRERLRLLGVDEATLRAMEAAEHPRRLVTIRAPIGGTIIERMMSEGNYVTVGTPLYRVADLSVLWVQLDAYEDDLVLLRPGQTVTLETSAVPGETFTGKVAFIDPVVDKRTRTARVRVVVPNREGALRPGMFVEAAVQAEADGDERLVIPATAPLFTGRRSLVYVELANASRPTYEAREVVLGPKAGDVYPVLEGLEAGERVVIHGAFALDADLQIRGGESMMMDEGAGGAELALPAAAREPFAAAIGAYLRAQKALAADDLAAAQAAAGDTGSALDALAEALAAAADDDERASEAPPNAGQKAAQRAAEAARALAASGDIEQARRHFDPLSREAIALVERYGNPLADTVRVAYCPMAIGDRGARWLQREERVLNSYFGASMLHCGEIEDSHDADAAGAETGAEPEGQP
ncbi:efflux RND transporter periplasmic adaptor subunit [Haliangium ochraceum]|uniref:Efflux transporter, RND family, MFP subunit n=1 Tax=Haliangium ochraceum (strain DSM 14365 / JCM 11303 / SMP-2) TaxID=502025 RepID=D0LX26_HALO1|nr:efflux RND transporter periplasmic adaptor subunit [Haliangium ochraceum]ACY16068.1 efflux transporter, RND family, MFP subunit [Haliangium ochraceum DSM 14365]